MFSLILPIGLPMNRRPQTTTRTASFGSEISMSDPAFGNPWPPAGPRSAVAENEAAG